MTGGGLAASAAPEGPARKRRRGPLTSAALVPSLDADLLAVVVARGGGLPRGAEETVAEAGGRVLVLGSGAREAAGDLAASLAADQVWAAETGPGLRPGALAAALVPLLADVSVVLLPASPDGRDLAPRLAAALDRPLLAHAVSVGLLEEVVRAELSRLDSRLLVDVQVPTPAVATLVPGSRAPAGPRGSARLGSSQGPTRVAEVQVLELVLPDVPDVDVVEVLEPDPSTMDLAEAPRVVGGGAGLVPRGAGDAEARGLFDLLSAVAARLGASAGATRVITDAGWTGHDRQIGTTGITVAPELYLALGVSGASQHTGGLGAPRHVISVNTDPSCPMTAMADLGLVTDAPALLLELADRLGVTP